MFGGFSLLVGVFATLLANKIIRRLATGILFIAVIAVVFAIVITSHSVGHMTPLAGPGIAWG